MKTIKVKTASASYPVHVGSGLVAKLGREAEKLLRAPAAKIFLLTSPEIWALWGKTVAKSFAAARQPNVLFLAPGETHKRMGQIERLANAMAEAGADRSSLLIALGGGIIGDMGGFLAAIYMRGIDYVQVPTTLLAQVDSSVGGKTGANLVAGKNLIGSFHHPKFVFADAGVLKTLPEREVRAGLYESIKAGIIRDAGLFRFLEKNHEAVLGGDAAMERVISASIKMKAEVVGIDERESGLRMILNYGHTIGHAIEAATQYKKMLHGEAVGWGMLAATEISRRRGLLTDKDAGRIVDVIHAYGPLPRFRTSVAALLDAAGRDKKNKAGLRRFVLADGIGKAVVVENVTEAEMTGACELILNEARS
ncbi:3-dehydroquinate synthase [Silvibacterium acidisoli]|uniref:3-dehydroquinate synthase n=1 Tax=Acidobacteriaceae bacterium ZG23-2 TaxID=2883246 RepID=UPI00406CF28D